MKLIIFDFDGVLVNTEEIAYQIHTIKNKNLTWERFKEYSEGNFHENYNQAVKEGKHAEPDDYYGSYKKALDTLTIHDILHNTIVSLSGENKLAIVSSTNGSFIADFLGKKDLLPYFSDILGADVHIDKTLKIKMILEKYEINPIDAVFITDTLGDIREANKCGVKSIAVTWGLHDRSVLSQGKPAKIIDDPRDLLKSVKEIQNG